MSYIQSYLTGVKDLLDALNPDQIQMLADQLERAWREDKHVILMGNGGSAGTASHIVNDIQKCLQLECGKPIKALCLSDNTPLVLAWANDTEFANIYQPQIECWVQPGDLVIAISGSGNSPNILRAADAAKKRGAFVFGMAGYHGGKLPAFSTECLVALTNNMQQIEDVHMIVLHLAFSIVRDRNNVTLPLES